MPKVSKDSAANVERHGPVEDRQADLDGYTVNFVTFRRGHRRHPADGGAARRPLPVPALGLRPQGRDTYRFADHDEVIEAGDAFYLRPATSRSSTPAANSCSSAPPSSCGRSAS